MKKQAGPDSVSLHNDKDLEAFVNHFDASVVGKYLVFQFCYVLLWLVIIITL